MTMIADERASNVKVLNFNRTGGHGGVMAFILNVLEGIQASGVSYDLLLWRKFINPEREAQFIGLGGRVHSLGFTKEQMYSHSHLSRMYSYVIELLRREKVDVFHVHTSEHNQMIFLLLLAAKRAGVPTRILHSHNSYTNSPRGALPHRRFQKRTIDLATHRFACSNLAGEWLFGNVAPFTVIKNGINPPRFTFQPHVRNAYRHSLDLHGKFVLGHVGRMVPQKNHAFLLEVFSAVKRKANNAMLMLAGTGELESRLRSKVQEMDLQDSVLFLGQRSDIPELMCSMDVFVLPSQFEGLAISAIEAQASSLPCVVSHAVSTEAKITGSIDFVDLSRPASYWADRVLSYRPGYERTDSSREIRAHGYDIKQIAHELSDFYLCKRT